MAWIFRYGATKTELVQELRSFIHGRTLAHEMKGNSLWAVKEHNGERYIVCYRLAQQDGRAWGYLELREQRYTPCNCPLSLLEHAPVIDAKWRERVRLYHAQHVKDVSVDEIWALKRSPVPHILVRAVGQLIEGVYAGRTYRFPRSQLVTRLRPPMAPVARAVGALS